MVEKTSLKFRSREINETKKYILDEKHKKRSKY